MRKDALVLNQRHFGLKPTGAFSTKKLHISCSFIQNQPTFLHIIAFFCSLISSLLVFELFSPIVILKTEHFDDKNDMEPQHRHIKLIRQKEAGRLYNHEIVSVH